MMHLTRGRAETAPVEGGEPFGARNPETPAQDRDRPHRVGVVDVGSNSVRLVVFDGAVRSPACFYNEKVLCGLGTRMAQTGKLNPEGRRRALAALKRFVLVGKGMAADLVGIATAAVRESSDGSEFCREVERTTGLRLSVASGEEEARLAGMGVIYGWPVAEGLVCDIGGWSLELAEIGGGTTGRRLTAPLGPLALQDGDGNSEPSPQMISASMADLRRRMDGRYGKIHLVGGSWRLIGRIDMERRGYPLKVLNEYQMPREETLRTIDWISERDPKHLKEITGTSPERLRLVKSAGMVLRSLVDAFRPDELIVSASGIREGLLFDRMTKNQQSADPLIEACLHMERLSSRLPGFGDRLFQFVRPLFSDLDDAMLRLVRAACLLHDANWRAHPDYRAEICFDSATRANLGGLDHPGRVFLGLALFHRYRNSKARTSLHRTTSLLTEDQARTAEILGKAMRFGATFTTEAEDTLGRLKFKPKKHVLTLVLPPAVQDMYGEVVEARLNGLADAMECVPDVKLG